MPSLFGGVCDVDLDPSLDARDAHPLWICAEDAMPHVRPASVRGVPRGQVFGLWRVRGRKRLLYAGADLILSAEYGPNLSRACLAPELRDGLACRLSMPFNGDAAALCMQARHILDDLPAPAFRGASRSAVLHLRALQALDARQAGLGQREVAEALFGADAVADHWHADSELRAQVRHILSRAEAWMRGGYLELARVRPR